MQPKVINFQFFLVPCNFYSFHLICAQVRQRRKQSKVFTKCVPFQVNVHAAAAAGTGSGRDNSFMTMQHCSTQLKLVIGLKMLMQLSQSLLSVRIWQNEPFKQQLAAHAHPVQGGKSRFTTFYNSCCCFYCQPIQPLTFTDSDFRSVLEKIMGLVPVQL